MPSNETQGDSATDTSSSSAAPVLKEILDLEEIDVNVFRGWSPIQPRWGRVYGGQTVSQAIVSAQRTVDASKYSIHSFHSYFLRPGDDDVAILYYVDSLKDSPSFCARRVVAVQAGVPIFTCAINFCSQERIPLEHQLPMPTLPAPDTLPRINAQFKELAQDTRLPLRTRKMLARSAVQPIPFDIKWIDEEDTTWEAWSPTPPLRAPRRRVWMRVRGRLPNQQTVHHVALAYLSDWGLINVASKVHGLAAYDPNVKPSSLDHTLYFHDPCFRADEWMLYDATCERMHGSRCLIIGKIFTQAGVHVVTVIQEALIRVRDAVSAALSPSPAIQRLLREGAPITAAAGASGPGPSSGAASSATSPVAVVAPPPAEGVETIVPHAEATHGSAFAGAGARDRLGEARVASAAVVDAAAAKAFDPSLSPAKAAAAAYSVATPSTFPAPPATAAGRPAGKGKELTKAGSFVPSLASPFAPSAPLTVAGAAGGAGATHSEAPIVMPSDGALAKAGPQPWQKPVVVALL